MTGVELIAAERERQVKVEGWTAEHDDEHGCGELATAAVCYAFASSLICDPRDVPVPAEWPWDRKWWKPADHIGTLAKAGALIAAEIDRLQRIKS